MGLYERKIDLLMDSGLLVVLACSESGKVEAEDRVTNTDSLIKGLYMLFFGKALTEDVQWPEKLRIHLYEDRISVIAYKGDIRLQDFEYYGEFKNILDTWGNSIFALSKFGGRDSYEKRD